MHDYRKLRVYQQALDLAEVIYTLTSRNLPRVERFGLSQQMNRASVSISSNLAEGAGRGSDPEFARFIRIALGSACELESQLQLCGRLGFIDETTLATLTNQVERLKAGLFQLERSVRAAP